MSLLSGEDTALEKHLATIFLFFGYGYSFLKKDMIYKGQNTEIMKIRRDAEGLFMNPSHIHLLAFSATVHR